MSMMGGFIVVSENFTESENYINKSGEHPDVFSIIYWDNIVLKNEELSDKNWLYIGSSSEKEKEEQLSVMKLCEGTVPIIE